MASSVTAMMSDRWPDRSFQVLVPPETERVILVLFDTTNTANEEIRRTLQGLCTGMDPANSSQNSVEWVIWGPAISSEERVSGEELVRSAEGHCHTDGDQGANRSSGPNTIDRIQRNDGKAHTEREPDVPMSQDHPQDRAA